MEALVIKSESGRDVTTSLKVAEVFGKDHKNVVRDIEALTCSEDFRSLNFEHTPYTHPQNKQTYSAYEMTKDGFTFLAMGYTGAKASQFKETFIAEFNKREALLQNDDFIISRAFELMVNRNKALEAAIETKDEQIRLAEKTIKEQAPLANYASESLMATNCSTAQSIAKEFGIGAQSLNRILHEKGVQYLQGEQWLLYAKYQNKGYTDVRTSKYTGSDGTTKTSHLTVWTERGRAFIRLKMKEWFPEGDAKPSAKIKRTAQSITVRYSL